MSNASPKIAAVGEIVLERYETGSERLGGISVNFARQAKRSGANAIVYGAVGNDPEGLWLRTRLTDEGLSTERVRVLPGTSSIQRLRLDNGERIFTGFSAGVLEDYELAPHELADLLAFDAIALPIAPDNNKLVASCISLRSQRQGRGPRLIGDFSIDSQELPSDVDSWLRGYEDVDVCFVGGNPEFLEPLEHRSSRSEQIFVLTAGAKGAWAIHRGTSQHQPSLTSEVINTCGCGDALAGAFTAHWLAGAPLERALREGALAAARIASGAS